MIGKYLVSIAFFFPFAVMADEEESPSISQEIDAISLKSTEPKTPMGRSSDMVGSSQGVQSASEHFQLNNIEAKAGYFFFNTSNMRHVYDHGGLDVQLSWAYGLAEWMRLYGSVEYMQKSGHSLNAHQHTSIWEIPLSLGLQPFVICWTSTDSNRSSSIYVTLGPRYIFAHVHNHSDYVPRNMNHNGLAGFVNGGVRFTFGVHGMLDFFCEYSYCKMRFHSSHPATETHTVQVGGLTFGGGLGVAF